jgi:hypothetical protein
MESIAGLFDNDRILFGYVTSCPLIRQVQNKKEINRQIFFSNATICPLWTSSSPLLVVAEV